MSDWDFGTDQGGVSYDWDTGWAGQDAYANDLLEGFNFDNYDWGLSWDGPEDNLTFDDWGDTATLSGQDVEDWTKNSTGGGYNFDLTPPAIPDAFGDTKIRGTDTTWDEAASKPTDSDYKIGYGTTAGEPKESSSSFWSMFGKDGRLSSQSQASIITGLFNAAGGFASSAAASRTAEKNRKHQDKLTKETWARQDSQRNQEIALSEARRNQEREWAMSDRLKAEELRAKERAEELAWQREMLAWKEKQAEMDRVHQTSLTNIRNSGGGGGGGGSSGSSGGASTYSPGLIRRVG